MPISRIGWVSTNILRKDRVLMDSISPEWRQFEELAARMERVLQPFGAKITCPDGVRDVVTGGVREVDASIRIESPTGQILISVECRQRKGAQDVTWIEQLVTKMSNISASRTIAVASDGFTTHAATMAAHYGIELRSFTEINDAKAIRALVPDMNVTAIITEYCLSEIRLYGTDGQLVSDTGLRDDVRSAIASEPLDATVALRRGTADQLCARWVVSRTHDDDVPPDGVEVRKTLSVTFDSDMCFVNGAEREINLSRAEFDVTFAKHERTAPSARVIEYTDRQAPLVREFHGTAEVAPFDGIGISVMTKPGRFNVHSVGVSMPKQLEAADGTPKANCGRFVSVRINTAS